MDVFGLLKRRLDFIKQLHQRSCAPFLKMKEDIEGGISPYQPIYFEESDEPAFLAEWIEAEESLQALGYSCVSMLATSLHLFFKTWESELGVSVPCDMKSVFKKKGWVIGYKEYFDTFFEIDFSESPIEIVRLQEIVRARNIAQHPKEIFLNNSNFSKNDIDNLGTPFFSSEIDKRMSRGEGRSEQWLLPLMLHIPPDKFYSALKDVNEFASWLDDQIYEMKGWNLPRSRMWSNV